MQWESSFAKHVVKSNQLFYDNDNDNDYVDDGDDDSWYVYDKARITFRNRTFE